MTSGGCSGGSRTGGKVTSGLPVCVCYLPVTHHTFPLFTGIWLELVYVPKFFNGYLSAKSSRFLLAFHHGLAFVHLKCFIKRESDLFWGMFGLTDSGAGGLLSQPGS